MIGGRVMTHARWCPKCREEWFCTCARSRRHQSKCAMCKPPIAPPRPLSVVLPASEALKDKLIADGRYEDAATVRDLRLWIKSLNQQKGQRK